MSALLDAAAAALRAGRPVLVADSEDRENEVDALLAAELASPQWIGWTVRHTSGYLCAPMPDALADHLDLPLMVPRTQDTRRTAYTVSVDAAQGVTTGISATDRARTLRTLADPRSGAADLIRPGHVLPLRAVPGGVAERPGHTEAAVDLCWLAGLAPVGVIGELVRDDGEVMRLDEARRFAEQEDLVVLTIAQLAEEIASSGGASRGGATRDAAIGGATRDASGGAEPRDAAIDGANRGASRDAASGLAASGVSADGPAPTAGGTPAAGWGDASDPATSAAAMDRVEHTGSAHLPTRHGPMEIHGFRDRRTGAEHVALVSDTVPVDPTAPVLVRVHSECLTGESFGSLRCECGPQLDESLRLIAERGGAVVHLRGHEGRGIGLLEKIAAYALQDRGFDTLTANLERGWAADLREYGAGAAILTHLGIARVELLTNNPQKAEALAAHGIQVARTTRLLVGRTPENAAYLRTKAESMGHLIPLDPEAGTDFGTGTGTGTGTGESASASERTEAGPDAGADPNLTGPASARPTPARPTTAGSAPDGSVPAGPAATRPTTARSASSGLATTESAPTTPTGSTPERTLHS